MHGNKKEIRRNNSEFSNDESIARLQALLHSELLTPDFLLLTSDS
jgi:hypothetical protein